MTYNFDVSYTVSVRVDNGPSLVRSGTVEVAAYDVVKATAAKNSGTVEVVIQPESDGGAAFVVMYADNYTDLSYTVDGGGSIVMEAPVMMIGAGAVSLLGATQLVLLFTNADTLADANIVVYVGRDATAPS
jgi:hypothetical protein